MNQDGKPGSGSKSEWIAPVLTKIDLSLENVHYAPNGPLSDGIFTTGTSAS